MLSLSSSKSSFFVGLISTHIKKMNPTKSMSSNQKVFYTGFGLSEKESSIELFSLIPPYFFVRRYLKFFYSGIFFLTVTFKVFVVKYRLPPFDSYYI